MVGLLAQRLKGATVCTVGSEPWRASVSDRILIAANRCAAFFVSTVSPDPETRIGTAARALTFPVDGERNQPP